MFNKPIASNMSVPTAAENRRAELDAHLKTGSLAVLNEKNYHKAYLAYSEALTKTNDLHIGDMKICVIKYMMCYCLVQSDKYDHLAEVVMTVQNISKILKERLPAVYIVLAQAHCKLFRFDYALEALTLANDIISKKSSTLEVFYIPGTNTPIEQSRNCDMWKNVARQCEYWCKPDAVCASKECNHVTKPYATPSMNIYKSDPAFNGMVITYCNNKKCPCVLKYHPSCWKVIKDSTNLVQKVTDKDMLGIQCPTPNCMDDNGPCSISIIEIVDQTGVVKAQIKKSPSNTWPINKDASKGAVKKQKPVYTKETATPVSTPQKEKIVVTPNKELNVKKKLQLYDGYDENQLITLAAEFPFNDFTSTPESHEKAFIFSYYHHYIKDNLNLVRVCDLYKTFSEINDSLYFFKDIDILSFLLETNVVVPVDDKSMNSIEDDGNVNDVLDDFMNDYDVSDTNEGHKINNNNILDKQCSLNACNDMYKEEAAVAGGDASSCYSSSNTVIDDSQINKDTDNQKLHDKIASLKAEIECLIAENSEFKKELQEKDHKIEVFVKQMEECEAIYEKMADFKAKYDEIKDENFKLKKEVIALINEKKSLTDEIEKLNDPEERRKEIKKTFQAEYKILQNCINASWEKKTKELEESLKLESETKKSLLSQYLKAQFAAHKNTLNGYIEQLKITLNVISNLNVWMDKYAGVKNFKNTAEWSDQLNELVKAAAILQNNFTEFLEKLYTSDDCPTDICLKCPIIPDAPKESLSDIVMNALSYYYRGQYEVMQGLLQKQQQLNQQQQFNQQQQRWHPQQLQRPVAYNMHAYSYVPPQQVLPFNVASITHSHVAYPVPNSNIVQPPVIQQPHHIQPVVAVQNGITVPIKKSDIEIKELSNSTENLSIAPKTSSHNELDGKEKINEEMKAESHELSAKQELKGDVKNEVKEPVDNIDSYFNQLAKRQEQLRKAVEVLTQNVQEKSEAGIIVETKQSKQCMNGDNDVTANGEVKSDSNNSQLKTYDDLSDGTSVTSKGDSTSPKSKKTAGINSLIRVMRQKFPSALEVDIIEAIFDIRKKNNNTLTGKPVIEILNEAEEYFSRNQRIHVMRYFLIDENKSSYTESSKNSTGSTQQSSLKDQVSSAPSNKFLNGTDTSSVQKKVWNVIPQEEVRWTAVSGEIECSICMNVVSKRTSYTLSCRHSFHTECIRKWFKSDRSCPNCRVAVTDDDEFPPLPA